MPCPSCGKPLPPGTISCPHCHTLVTQQHTGAGNRAPTTMQTGPNAPVVHPTPIHTAPIIEVPAPVVGTPVIAPAPAPVAATPFMAADVRLPASRGRRFVNYVIDAIVLYILGLLVGVVANPSNKLIYGILLGFVTSLVFYVVFETVFQKTPGKMVTGTRVVMRDGSKPGLKAIMIRSLIRIIPFEALTFLTRTTPSGWHDRWAGVYVVPNSYSEADVQAIDMSKAKPAKGLLILTICFMLLIPVLGIVSAILLTSLNAARMKGRDAERVTHVKQLQLALELYLDANGHYPATLKDLPATDIPTVPTDPMTNQPYPYILCASGAYHIGANLEESTSNYLSNDADSPPLCTEDTISGDDAHACTAQAAGYCYDVTSEPAQATQTPQK